MAVHKAGGGKRRTAGVADYFAVLGMHLAADDNDEDDPHPPSPSPSPSSPPMSGDNDPGRDAQKPAGDDVGDLDDDDGECAVPPSSSSAAAEPDGGVGDDGASSSSSSSPPSGTERNRHYSDMTPRNRRNLSRKVLPLRDDDDAAREDGGGGGGGGGGGRTSAEADGDRALRLLREERFRREIVGLALISSPLALPNDDDGGDGGDDESSRWTVAGEADLPVVFPRGRGDPMTAVRGGVAQCRARRPAGCTLPVVAVVVPRSHSRGDNDGISIATTTLRGWRTFPSITSSSARRRSSSLHRTTTPMMFPTVATVRYPRPAPRGPDEMRHSQRRRPPRRTRDRTTGLHPTHLPPPPEGAAVAAAARPGTCRPSLVTGWRC